jgi:hypothetical protein
MDNFISLRFLEFRNFIASFKHHSTNRGYIANIILLKSKSYYYYIHDNCFFEQMLDQKVFFFKMLVHGVAKGVNPVKQIQLGDDLKNPWIMFDIMS